MAKQRRRKWDPGKHPRDFRGRFTYSRSGRNRTVTIELESTAARSGAPPSRPTGQRVRR